MGEYDDGNFWWGVCVGLILVIPFWLWLIWLVWG
jgi:hypothetical protein